MKAIFYRKSGDPEVVETDEPKINNKDWIIVKVERVGLCGSDIQKFLSKRSPKTYSSTAVLGHEIAGRVVEVGEDVSQIKINDRVVINPLIFCGYCGSCRQKKFQLCENLKSVGKNLQGGFAEYISIPAKNALKFSRKINFDEACLNDLVAVGIHSFHLAKSPRKKTILIIGDGPVALILIQILRYYENKLYILGKHSKNIGIAKSLGARVESPKPTDQRQFDIIFETVGRRQSDTMTTAISRVKLGGIIIVLGVFDFGFIGKIQFRELFYKEITLLGSNSYGFWKNKDEFNKALRLVETGIIKPKKIVSHVFSLTEFRKALNYIKGKNQYQTVKILFDPGR